MDVVKYYKNYATAINLRIYQKRGALDTVHKRVLFDFFCLTFTNLLECDISYRFLFAGTSKTFQFIIISLTYCHE